MPWESWEFRLVRMTGWRLEKLPLKTPPESTATGAMFWKNMASGWRSLTMLSFLLIRSAQFVGQRPTVSPMWKNNSIDREWPVLTVRVDWAQVTFLKQKVVFFRALRVKVRCAQCHAKLNPGGAGIWLATWDFQLHLVESNLKNGSRKPKLYFNTINFNNLFVPDNGRRLGQISGQPIIDFSSVTSYFTGIYPWDAP